MRSRGDMPRGEPPTPAATYEFRLAGRVEMRWYDWFDAPEVAVEGGETVLRLRIADQSALHGALVTLRDLGLTLVAFNRRDPGEASESSGPTSATPDQQHLGREQGREQ